MAKKSVVLLTVNLGCESGRGFLFPLLIHIKAMKLRYYQEEAIQALYAYLQEFDDNPLIELPTGAGKSVVLAQICSDAVKLWGGRVLLLTHVKELLEQSADKIRILCPGIPVGVHSAGLGSRSTEEPIVVGGIQSVAKRIDHFGHFDLIIIDEVQLVPLKGEGQYRTVLFKLMEKNPNVRIIGLTATPYRLDSGLIARPDGILNHICYEVGVRELIEKKFLSPLVNKHSAVSVDTSGIAIKKGEFDSGEMEELWEKDGVVEKAVAEIMTLTKNRNGVLLFCSGVVHAKHVAKAIRSYGVPCGEVYGETPKEERDYTLTKLKRMELKYVVNVNVLTVGFDAPHIDCICLLRDTMSPGLAYQMIGRGLRVHESKQNCLVLDYCNNLLRHGPIDQINPPKNKNLDATPGEAPAKECPECNEVVHARANFCPDCGYEWPLEETKAKHGTEASDADPLASVSEDVFPVKRVEYSVHRKRDNPDSKTLKITYHTGDNLVSQSFSEWVCVEHSGFAYQKACKWWHDRSDYPIPECVEEAVNIAQFGLIKEPSSIIVRRDPKSDFPRIIHYDLPLEHPNGPAECPDCGVTVREYISCDGWDGEAKYEEVCYACGRSFRSIGEDIFQYAKEFMLDYLNHLEESSDEVPF